jgi:O-acetyl-ADP-ribose deacetylase (regulator of RNase III)
VSGAATIELVQGDITKQRVDAIVNAANSELAHGGGVAAAILRAAGPELARESAAHPRVAVGGAGVTSAGELPARWVIHAVGPVWSGGTSGEPELLDSAYRSALGAAAELGARSIAFPSISTGIYGYPVEDAARVAIAALRAGAAMPDAPATIRICLFSAADLAVYERALDSAAG